MILDYSRVAAFAVAGVVAICAMSPAVLAKTPSYATPGETITGTIASVQNVNHIFVADDRGYTDDVTLRSGAQILAGGLRLEPGARVTIVGSSAGPTFLATRIATSGRGYAADGSTTVAPYSAGAPAYYPASGYYPAPAYYSYRPYPADFFRFGFGYGPFYRGYGFGYGPFYRGYGFGYRPFYHGYGFGYGYFRGYGFGYGPYYRGYALGHGPFYRGSGFDFRAFSGGHGFRASGSFGVHGRFR